ncbi:LTXXQ motif family protein [Roseomonas rosea]|uniref:LTXXQ motif family protein n=2 Tax=Muricoccus roseus TaxID=198092 RepID=A0A1M6QNT1_9PROT|nr:LTXXQ motif family protein [Roseomonas rosea]
MPGAGAPGGPPGSTPGMMGGDMQPMMMQMMRRMMAGQGAIGGSGPTRPFQRVEGELAYFRAELRITDAQVPQWNTLAEAIRGAVGQLRRAFGEATPASQRPVPAIAQLERRIALLSVQLDTARVVAAAAGPLYAALSDEQKLMADELMAEHLSLVPRMGM